MLAVNCKKCKMKSLKYFWKNYKYRFTPWIYINFPIKAKRLEKTPNYYTKKGLSNNLLELFKAFKYTPDELVFRDNYERKCSFEEMHRHNQEIMLKQVGTLSPKAFFICQLCTYL